MPVPEAGEELAQLIGEVAAGDAIAEAGAYGVEGGAVGEADAVPVGVLVLDEPLEFVQVFLGFAASEVGIGGRVGEWRVISLGRPLKA